MDILDITVRELIKIIASTLLDDRELSMKDIAEIYGLSTSSLRHQKWLLPRFGEFRPNEKIYKCTMHELKTHMEKSRSEMKQEYLLYKTGGK